MLRYGTGFIDGGADLVDRFPGGFFGHLLDGSFFRPRLLLVGTAPESPDDQGYPDKQYDSTFFIKRPKLNLNAFLLTIKGLLVSILEQTR
jgi:hypothetical protein